MLRTLASQARGVATLAAQHTGLLELRQYTMKPEGIKVGSSRNAASLDLAMLAAALITLLSSASPLCGLQEFMRLTNEKLELRKSLLPFLG